MTDRRFLNFGARGLWVWVIVTSIYSACCWGQVEDPLKNENPSAYMRAKSLKTAGSAELPRIIAVRVHHDLCPFCKLLKKELANVRKDTASQSVLWITLDLTSEASQEQSAMLAASLGLQQLWTGDMTKMGSVTFMDGVSKNPVGVYRPGMNDTLQEALARALAAERTTESKDIRSGK